MAWEKGRGKERERGIDGKGGQSNTLRVWMASFEFLGIKKIYHLLHNKNAVDVTRRFRPQRPSWRP